MGEHERILIADDMEDVREGLKAVLETFGPDHEVVAEADSVESVGKVLEAGIRPTLAIVDGNMPQRGDGERAAKIMREQDPKIKIISLSSDHQDWGDVNLERPVSAEVLVGIIDRL